MRKTMWRKIALGSVLCGMATLVIAMSQMVPTESGATTGEFTLGEGVQHKNLTIFPVIARVAREDDDFITLDEGLKAGTVVVAELRPNVADFDQRLRPVSDVPHAAPIADLIAEPTAPVAADQSKASDDLFGDPSIQPAPTALAGAVPTPTNKVDSPESAAADPLGLPSTSPSSQQPAQVVAEGVVAEVRRSEQPQAFVIPAGADIDLFSTGPSVNTVTVLNRSDRSLYLMPGEIIVGGQQDRTLAREMVIPPGDKPVAVDVYCVEHGRWNGRASHETAALIQSLNGHSLACDIAQLSDKAVRGEFVDSAGSLNKGSRLAVQSRAGQSAVWDEVRMNNRKTGAEVDTDAFTANYVALDVRSNFQPYIDALQARVANESRIVGVVVAINGKPEIADVFGSTPLFRKLWPKLLKSYALDASVAAVESEKIVCTKADAQAFLDAASEANVIGNERHEQGLFVKRQSSDRVETFSAALEIDETRAFHDRRAEVGVVGGFGGSLRSATFAK